MTWRPVLGAVLGAAVAASPAAAQARSPEFAPALGVHLEQMERTNRGVHYRDLVVGEGPGVGSSFTVTIHYTGWLPDGTQFETSRQDGEPVTFRLDDRRIIRGWEEGIRGMRPGGVRQLVIPPQLAYGRRGLPPAIPPDATLVFEVELVRASR